MKPWNSLWTDAPLFLASKHQATLQRLLNEFLLGRTVWAFGSRATGEYLGRFSDLDLAVEGCLPPGVRGDLLEALDESDLPIKVDIVELGKADADFAERIRRDFVVVQAATQDAAAT